MVLTGSDDLLLCRGEGDKMTLHAYFNVASLFQPEDEDPVVMKALDASKPIVYEQDECFPGDRLWQTHLRWPTYRVGQHRPPVVASTISEIPPVNLHAHRFPIRYTGHWLDLDEMLDDLKYRPVDNTTRASRNHHRITWNVSMGHSDDWCSSADYRAVWLDSYQPSLSEVPMPQLRFFTLVSPVANSDYDQKSGYPGFAAQGILDVPIDLWEVNGVDFCDEPGCVVITTDRPNDDVKRTSDIR